MLPPVHGSKQRRVARSGEGNSLIRKRSQVQILPRRPTHPGILLDAGLPADTSGMSRYVPEQADIFDTHQSIAHFFMGAGALLVIGAAAMLVFGAETGVATTVVLVGLLCCAAGYLLDPDDQALPVYATETVTFTPYLPAPRPTPTRVEVTVLRPDHPAAPLALGSSHRNPGSTSIIL